jgi:hypothetical protein
MTAASRDNQLRQIETQIRQAIRDAVNRNSRKPFYWGGLAGYQQLEAIAAALPRSTQQAEEIGYLLRLAQQVHRALEKNRRQAQDIQEAHTWLGWIAEVLHYPLGVQQKTGCLDLCSSSEKTIPLSSTQVAQNMESLLQRFHPNTKFQPVQAKLAVALRKRWKLYSQELLHCYDISGLPPDNLQMEALFGRLRRHQRRISGRKSTRELRNFGQAQVLFRAESEPDLLKQIQHVPLADFQAQQRQLMEAETPCQFFHRLHQDPSKTMLRLVNQYQARSMYLTQMETLAIQPVFEHLHTE